jgi:hypothetical protein
VNKISGDLPGIADIALAHQCAGAGYFDCPLDPLPWCVRTHPLAIKAAADA